MTFFQGESLHIIFKASDPATGEMLNISGWDISVGIYTSRFDVRGFDVTRLSDSEFSVSLTPEHTRRMKPGAVNVQVTMTKEEDTRIGKGIIGTLLDPLASSCGCSPVSCTTVNATVVMDCNNLAFTMEMGNEIIIPGANCLIIMSQWEHDKTVISEAITEQGIPTEPEETGDEMAGKIKSLQIAVPSDPSLQPPPANVVDLWNVMYNNQRAGHNGMYGTLLFPLSDPTVNLSGADAYLTSDGVFYTSNTQHTFADPLIQNWIIYYSINTEYAVTIDATNVWIDKLYLYKGVVSSLALSGNNITEVISARECYISNLSTRLLLNRLQRLILENTTDILNAYAFCSGNNQLSYIYLPSIKRVTSASTSAFSNMGALQVINLPELEEVASGTFLQTVPELSVVNFPKLRIITGSIFLSTPKIKKVSFPELETVTISSFVYSSALLESVELPKIVTLTGSSHFATTPNLKYLFLPATPGGQIGNVWANCSIEILELEQGFTKPLDITSLTLPTRETLVNHIFQRMGPTSTPIVVKLGATNYAKVTADDIQILTDKGYTVTV